MHGHGGKNQYNNIKHTKTVMHIQGYMLKSWYIISYSLWNIWFMQAMNSMSKPQPDMRHQANWKPVQPLSIGQEQKRHTSHHSHSTGRKEAQHTALGPSKPLRKEFNSSSEKDQKGQKGERPQGKAFAPVEWRESWEVCLRGGGRLGGGWVSRGKHHSLDAALGRHRPLPSADWWEPTQLASRICYCWFFWNHETVFTHHGYSARTQNLGTSPGIQ